MNAGLANAMVQVSRDGRYVVVREPDGLAIVSTLSQAVDRLTIPTLASMAIVGDELWCVMGTKLQRLTPRGQVIGTPLELDAPHGQLRSSAERIGQAALLRTGAGLGLVTVHQRALALEPIAVTLGDDDFAEVLAGNRIIICQGDRFLLYEGTRSNLTTARLRTSGRIVGATSIFDGNGICLHVVEAGGQEELRLFNRGALVRSVEIGPTQRIAIAGKAAVAVLWLASGELEALDLRAGATLGRRPVPFRIRDLAIGASGRTCVLVEDNGAARPVVTFVDLAEVFAPIARPAEPADPDAPTPAPAASPAAPPPAIAAPPADLAEPAPPPPRPRPPRPAPAPPPPRDAEYAATQRLIELAMSHAALLFERLFSLCRNVGLLPRTSSAEDPLGPIVVTDVDVATMLAGLDRLKNPSARMPVGEALAGRLAASRAALRQGLDNPAARHAGLVRLIRAFAIDDGLLDLLLLALAPDWDLRFTRLCGFLNNDTTVTRPRFGHLLALAQATSTSTSTELLVAIDRALFDYGLLLREGPQEAPLVTHTVRCPDFVVDISTALLESGEGAPSPGWDELRWDDDDKAQLREVLDRELLRTDNLRLIVLEGPPGSGRMATARAAAAHRNRTVEVCDLPTASSLDVHQLEPQISRSVLRAYARGSVLIVRSDGLLRAHDRLWKYLWERTERFRLPCFVLTRSGELETLPPSLRFVRHRPPSLRPTGRRELWSEALADRGIPVSNEVLDDIAGRYDITPGRLLEVADELRLAEDWTQRTVEVRHLRETLRAITLQRLGKLATRYQSSITMADLIYPASVVSRIDELVGRVRFRHRVLSVWSFADKAHDSYGVSALFYGPPGTGKTAGAAALANALQIDLYIVDFSSIMSKWVGETEQNLAKVFDEAEASSVALLFDEADSLFGKRSTSQDNATDRFANLTVNYLIQRMESFNGIAILTTNLETAMDDAFQRRITARIRFPESEPEQRVELWRCLLPRGARYADDVDLHELANLYKMEGAYIRRALTRAAFSMASSGRGGPVLTQRDLMRAALAEYEDMGRVTHATDARVTRAALHATSEPS